MADTPENRAARETVRADERTIWTEVERVGRELRAAEAAKQTMTQSDRDTAVKNPTEG